MYVNPALLIAKFSNTGIHTSTNSSTITTKLSTNEYQQRKFGTSRRKQKNKENKSRFNSMDFNGLFFYLVSCSYLCFFKNITVILGFEISKTTYEDN